MEKLILLILLLASIVTVYGQEDESFNSEWNNGFKLESTDGNFKLKFGGRLMMDWAFISQDEDLENTFGESDNGFEFRRVRLFNSGLIYNAVSYMVDLGFSGGEISFKDMFLEIPLNNFGDLRLGHFKEPFRLEALTSSKYITFMERSQRLAFSPLRNSGIMVYNELFGGGVGYQIGIFHNANSVGDDVSLDGTNFTTRITGKPIDANGQFLHLGLCTSFRKPKANSYQVSSRPAAHLAKKYVSTGTIENVDKVTLINTELAYVINSFSLQGEYLTGTVDRGHKEKLSGYYGHVSYFLTGERKIMKGSYDGFDRIKPKNNFGSSGGIGAWELILRYSSIDIDDQDIRGGVMNDITFGINWYLNPSTRFMINYVLANVNNEGKANIFQIRGQVDF